MTFIHIPSPLQQMNLLKLRNSISRYHLTSPNEDENTLLCNISGGLVTSVHIPSPHQQMNVLKLRSSISRYISPDPSEVMLKYLKGGSISLEECMD